MSTLSLGLAALAGAMLSYARGTGSYDGDAGAGTVESTLTGVFPFAGVDLSDRPVTASMVIMTLGTSPARGLNSRPARMPYAAARWTPGYRRSSVGPLRLS